MHSMNSIFIGLVSTLVGVLLINPHNILIRTFKVKSLSTPIFCSIWVSNQDTKYLQFVS